MDAQNIDNLKLYQEVELRDGRVGLYQEINEQAKESNNPFIIVNVLPKGSLYCRDEAFWPAQIKGAI